MTTLIVDLLGWFGALLILVAYWLVSTRRLAGDAIAYQLPNLVGGLLLVVNTVYYGAYPSTLVNVVWMGVAIWSLARSARAAANASAGR